MNMHRAITPVFLLVLLSGCSVAVYSPVIGMSVLGMDKESLSDNPKYKQILNRNVILPDEKGQDWVLRRFSSGRNFISKAKVSDESGVSIVCYLSGKELVITDVYTDKVNGGVFYSASVSCDGNTITKVPKSYWYPELDSLTKLL